MRSLQARIESAKCSVVILRNRRDQIKDQAVVLLETCELYDSSIDELEERIAELERQ